MTNASQFKGGLDGIVVAQTAISEVDGEHGKLTYRGYLIGEIAEKATFEEVAHLLWVGHLPTTSELSALKSRLVAARPLPDAVLTIIAALPATTEPMDVLRTAVSAYGAATNMQGKPTLDQAISLTAIFPTILAAFDRRRNGKEFIAPRNDLDHAANYLYMLNGSAPEDRHVHSLNTYLNLLADHGMNASTFTARVISSTESDLCSAVSGAIGALKGPLHGGAPALVLKMLQEIGKPENAQSWIAQTLDSHGKIMGIGHRVYKTYDPRAEILREMARTASTPDFFALAQTTEQAALDELHRRKPDERLWTNVEFYSASVLYSVGLPGDLFTPTFGVARVAGWTAHVLEQLQKNRLMRPESTYIGPRDLKFVPVEQRTGQ
jgi:citrate synthase